jgi:hypothetical protein
MNAELTKDLIKLAKKHHMELSFSCIYCSRRKENFGSDGYGDSFMVTFTEKVKVDKKH